MALNAGNTACSSGLSQRIYNELTGASGNGFSGTLSAAQTDAVKAICYAVAKAVVDEVAANAAVSVTVPSNSFGVSIPASPTSLSGTVS